MDFEPPIPLERSFDALYGLEILSHGDGEIRGQIPVRDEVKQPMGLVHGGVYAAAGEALASMATFVAVVEDGQTAMGISNFTSFVRPISEGTIHAVGRASHRGRTTWLWDVSFSDDQDRLCALARVTVAVRPMAATKSSG